jgi:hypothetical protein
MKIDIIGTCPNFQLSPIGTLVLYGLINAKIIKEKFNLMKVVLMEGLKIQANISQFSLRYEGYGM